MFRGTTPTLKWRVNSELDLKDVKEIWLILREKNNQEHSIVKTLSNEEIEMNFEEKFFSYTLTQEETLSFCKGVAGCQVRILLNNGLALASSIKNIEIENVLKGGVIE